MTSSKPCIFCGRHGDKSREHFYPAWLANHVSMQHPIHHTAETFTASGYAPAQLTKSVRRQGHLVTRKLRVVCRTCNNGWMSQLEESAKPLLLRGFDAETFTLTPKDQGLLSRWACMKAMVAEQSEPDLATTPAIDRLAFHDTQVPPFYFRVTLGVHVTSSQTWFLRRTMTLSFSPTVQPPLVDGLEKN